MKKDYDFDEIVPRRGTCSVKWDTPEYDDATPMWVADMDFKAAPPILDALRRRVEHGVFGYTKVPDEYFAAITEWFERRHRWRINPADVIYTSGVVPALAAIIKAFTRPGDKIIVQTPAYNCFFSCIGNAQCELLANRLVNKGGVYSIDFDDLEMCASDPRATMMILCNPHNPVGRVWSSDELRRIAEICHRHGVLVISDEIHCELVYPGHEFIPFALIAAGLSVPTVICNSPSKAFNIAGLQIANIIAPNAAMRAKIDRAININEVCDVNPFGVAALIAAYREGGEWLDDLTEYLRGNYELVRDYFAANLPEFEISPLEATYLMWIRVEASGHTGDEIAERLLCDHHIMVSPGSIYRDNRFIRLNIATSRRVIERALPAIADTLRKG